MEQLGEVVQIVIYNNVQGEKIFAETGPHFPHISARRNVSPNTNCYLVMLSFDGAILNEEQRKFV